VEHGVVELVTRDVEVVNDLAAPVLVLRLGVPLPGIRGQLLVNDVVELAVLSASHGGVLGHPAHSVPLRDEGTECVKFRRAEHAGGK
jgi:hypothetical protein